MNIDDLYDDIEELEDENNPDNEELINSLSCLISAMKCKCSWIDI